MRAILLSAALLLPAGACASLPENPDRPQPVGRAAMGDFGEATLRNAAGQTIGRAVLTQGPTGLLIRIEATGLTPAGTGFISTPQAAATRPSPRPAATSITPRPCRMAC